MFKRAFLQTSCAEFWPHRLQMIVTFWRFTMEVISFLNQRFHEIPEQDNPVFNTSNYIGEKLRAQECILVCKVSDVKTSGVGDGFKVIHVPIQGEVIRRGVFWKGDDAMVFAETISQM